MPGSPGRSSARWSYRPHGQRIPSRISSAPRARQSGILRPPAIRLPPPAHLPEWRARRTRRPSRRRVAQLISPGTRAWNEPNVRRPPRGSSSRPWARRHPGLGRVWRAPSRGAKTSGVRAPPERNRDRLTGTGCVERGNDGDGRERPDVGNPNRGAYYYNVFIAERPCPIGVLLSIERLAVGVERDRPVWDRISLPRGRSRFESVSKLVLLPPRRTTAGQEKPAVSSGFRSRGAEI